MIAYIPVDVYIHCDAVIVHKRIALVAPPRKGDRIEISHGKSITLSRDPFITSESVEVHENRDSESQVKYYCLHGFKEIE
jgi:hypothetical protein